MIQPKMKSDSYYELSRPEIARIIVGEPKKILEIGCAAGNFKNNIGWDCDYHGVDPSADAIEKAARKGITTYHGTYDTVKNKLPDHYFDLIIANDVIEHMECPSTFLKSIRDKLAENGYIIGSVPNVRYITNLWNLLLKRDWLYTEAGVLDNTHLRFFTPKSIARTLTEAGFSIDYLKPSGPVRYTTIKKLLYPFVFPIGIDTLYMQIAFRCSLVNAKQV